MNRRELLRTVTIGSMLSNAMTYSPTLAQGTPELGDLTPVTRGHLYGNAFELLPTGSTDTVETVAQAMSQRSIYKVMRNNSNDTVMLAHAEGMVRDSDGTPLSVPLAFDRSSDVVEPGEYLLVNILLGETLESTVGVVDEFTFEWEPFTSDSFVFTHNLSVQEAERTSTRYIGTFKNDTEEPFTSWVVTSFCFDIRGQIVGAGWDAGSASQELSEGGSQSFGVSFFYGQPTDRFLIGARTQF